MKKQAIMAIVLAAAVLGGCSSKTAETTAAETEETSVTSEETTTAETTETSETTAETTVAETTEETTSETSEETKSEEVTIKAHYDIDEDEYYFATNYKFDDDLGGVTLDLYSYCYITQEEFDSLEIGDVIETYYGEEAQLITIKKFDTYMNRTSVDTYGNAINKQEDGRYFFDDGMGSTAQVLVYEQVHFDLDLRKIADAADVYGDEGIRYDERTTEYNSLQEFIDDLNSDAAFRTPNLHVLCEGDKITEIYINPECHEGWK